MNKPLAPSPRRTTRVAQAAAQHEGRELVTPREIADAPFAKGQSPSLPARRTLLLMIATAAAEGFADKPYRLTKRELRQGHKGNERIGELVDEVMAIRFAIPSLSGRGRASIVKAYLFEEIEEETDEGDKSLVEFSFSRRARALFSGSDVYASLSRSALMAFTGRYAVTLYQLGCLYAGRRDPTIRLTVPDLRQRLGVPVDVYGDFAQLRREVLVKAKAEVDQLAHFQVGFREHREGRKVVAVSLSFWRKEDRAIDAAADELERPKVGRKARRKGQVERVQTDIEDITR